MPPKANRQDDVDAMTSFYCATFGYLNPRMFKKEFALMLKQYDAEAIGRAIEYAGMKNMDKISDIWAIVKGQSNAQEHLKKTDPKLYEEMRKNAAKPNSPVVRYCLKWMRAYFDDKITARELREEMDYWIEQVPESQQNQYALDRLEQDISALKQVKPKSAF